MHESVDDILDFAIGREREAVALYTDLEARTENEYARNLFRQLVGEEEGHAATLAAVKERGLKLRTGTEEDRREALRRHLAERVHASTSPAKLSFKDAIGIALKRETEAFNLYNDLAEAAEEEALKEIFLDLARQEAAHKRRFETEYFDSFMV
jgi:rubrerythrin